MNELLAITAATTAVFWAAEGFEAALPVALVLGALTAVVHYAAAASTRSR
jgi:hypothetical protein